MNNHNKTDYMSWTILIGLLLLVVEITFFNKGVVFSLFFAGVFLYFGGKRLGSLIGKLVFGIGFLGLFFTTIDMIVFKFLIIAVIAYLVIYFFNSKYRPLVVQPVIKDSPSTMKMVRQNDVIKNLFYGQQKTPNEIYEWHDINIQTGIGDAKIDLSNTVLPKGEAVIAIRNFIGNIQILVPYDIEVNVTHSVLVGNTTIFEETDEKLFNQTLNFRTDNYDEAFLKVKIITSMGIGRLEVKRI